MITSFIGCVIIIVIIFMGKKNNNADWGHWGANILDGWIRIYCRRFHRQKNQTITLPDVSPLILAPNHISGIDPFLLITATNKPIRFMIAKEEYEKPILNWMFRAAGCIPVDRNGRVDKAFRSVLRALKDGEIVALFPQGGIHSEETQRHLIKPGIIKLSQLSQSYILPVRINGVGAQGTVARSTIKRSHVVIEQHAVLTPQDVLQPEFRFAISQWLLGETEKI